MSSNANHFYAQTRSETKHDPVDAESEANALLTFADMVLALDTTHDTCDSDHTYAGYESEENVAQLLEAEILIQKEKDHPYAFSGRWKGRPPNSSRTNQPSTSVSFVSRQRSSSEENLFRPTATMQREANGTDGLTARKCHSYEKVSMTDTFKSAKGGMFVPNFEHDILHGARTVYGAAISTSNNEEIVDIPLSCSLPVEDSIVTNTEKLAMDVDPPEKDHTYARAKSKSDKANKPVINKQFHIKEKKDAGHKTEAKKKENTEPFVLISDHTYHDKIGASPFMQTKFKHARPAKSVLVTAEMGDKLQTSDHTYYTSSGPKRTHPPSTVGPVNSQLSPLLFAPRNDRSDHNYSTTA
ncbi:uncharacterized protein LOC121375477 [Gigantopelta aegis]|uniref:uncharacterized protein LOC121375477 n=1 Tax=Gigantopelta aegis TaxID=1735272 RepID=UPI001B88D8E8|nr:uncharacterized protein LOC121375477 [Gigantopelta aegis]